MQPAHCMVPSTWAAWDIHLSVRERGHRGQNSQNTNLAQLQHLQRTDGENESGRKLGWEEQEEKAWQ